MLLYKLSKDRSDGPWGALTRELCREYDIDWPGHINLPGQSDTYDVRNDMTMTVREFRARPVVIPALTWLGFERQEDGSLASTLPDMRARPTDDGLWCYEFRIDSGIVAISYPFGDSSGAIYALVGHVLPAYMGDNAKGFHQVRECFSIAGKMAYGSNFWGRDDCAAMRCASTPGGIAVISSSDGSRQVVTDYLPSIPDILVVSADNGEMPLSDSATMLVRSVLRRMNEATE